VLGGHCHGGLIALEMARQLRAHGEEIELVLMIDTTAPPVRLRMLRRALNAGDRLRGRAFRAANERFDVAMRVMREIRWRARYYQKRAGMLASAGIGAQIDFARRKLGVSPPSGGSAPSGSAWRFYAEPPRPVNLRQAQRRAYARHVPSRYAGPVILFRAELYPARRPDLGWSRYLPRLEVVVVPGDHHSCITRHVAAFAAHMNAALSEPARD
jgi:thioesterase domain-containing protein